MEFDLDQNQDDGNNNNFNTINYNHDSFKEHKNNPIHSVSSLAQNPPVPNQKIARDSLIHKNDVFQFDDVESVHTHDSLFKQTPQSSFESDVFKPNGVQNAKSFTKKKLVSQFISPLLRGVNGHSSSNGSVKKSSKKQLSPKSISSLASTSSPQGKKSVPNIVEEKVKDDTASIDIGSALSRRLNSFRKLIGPNRNSAQNLNTNSGKFLTVNADIVKSSSVELLPTQQTTVNTNLLDPNRYISENINSTSVDNFKGLKDHDGLKGKSKKLFNFKLTKSKKSHLGELTNKSFFLSFYKKKITIFLKKITACTGLNFYFF